MPETAYQMFFSKVASAIRKGNVTLEREGKRKRGHDTRMVISIFLYENGEKTDFRFVAHPCGMKEIVR